MELLIDIALAAVIGLSFGYVMVLSAAEAICAEQEEKRNAFRLDE